MLAIPGIAAIIIFIYARPQEFFESLRVVPWLHVFLGLALFGGLLDLRIGNSRLRGTPQLPWILLLFAWAALVTFVAAPHAASSSLSGFAICITLYLLIAHGVQSFRALAVVAGVVLAMVVFVCGVSAHQGFSRVGCVVVDESAPGDTVAGRPDGRPCDTVRSCYSADAEPGADYACEHIGLFGTTSVGGGRVRYRGVLQDPNELALAGGVGLPLAFSRRREPRTNVGRRVISIATFLLVLVCAVLTGSRGGQLVFLAVLGTYFVHRFGFTGVALAGLMSGPLLLLGGRSGAEATSSTMERLDCWAEALSIWRSHPLLGIGLGQFGEYNYMTAHNSYLLALAELGLPGMLLFSIVLYISAKIPVAVLRAVPITGDGFAGGAPIARPWAMALLAAFAGLAIGIFFLSFSYHYVLWIYLGLSGALYSAVRTHVPDFAVPFGWRDAAIVFVADVGIIGLVHVYTRAVLG